MIFTSKDTAVRYRAPLLGNGDVLLPIDHEGAMPLDCPHTPILPSMQIARAGHLRPDGSPLFYGRLFPQMSFLGKEVARPYYFSAELDTRQGILSSSCEYEYGIHLDTRICVFHNRPLAIVSKKFISEAPVHYSYCYEPPVNSGFTAEVQGKMVLAEYNEGSRREKLCFFCSHPVRAEVRGGFFRLTGDFQKGATVTWYLYFSDGETGDTLFQNISDIQSYVYKQTEARLFSEHAAAWAAYTNENVFQTEDAAVDAACDGAQYLLHCLTSPRGVPLAFDHPISPAGHAPTEDLQVVCALLHGGHEKDAAKILSFWRGLLPAATARFCAPGEDGARYPYYTDENGREMLPDDYRRDRVIQTAAVAAGFYEYWLYTGNRAFLAEQAYPVLLGCARYLTRQCIRAGTEGTCLVCSDLDRLGAAVQRPLLSTLGVCAALTAFAEAATLLRAEPELAATSRRLSEELLRSLAVKDSAYLAAPGVLLPTEAPLFAGFFRTEADGERLRRALISYAVTPAATSSAFRTALLAVAYARAHVSAGTQIAKLAEATDIYGLPTESAPDGTATLPAVFLDAAYQSVLGYSAGRIYVGFGLTPDRPFDCTFRLPLPIEATAEGRIRGGKLVSFRLTRRVGSSLRAVDVVMPKWLYEEGAAVAVKKTERGGILYLNMVVR